MWWFTPKISWTTTRPALGVPLGAARYAERRWPSSAVRLIICPIDSLLVVLPVGHCPSQQRPRQDHEPGQVGLGPFEQNGGGRGHPRARALQQPTGRAGG